jgi:hypothetical protein
MKRLILPNGARGKPDQDGGQASLIASLDSHRAMGVIGHM